MSRRSKNASGATTYAANPPTGGNTGGSGGGGTRFSLSSPINIALGKKGITVTGAAIETINVPLRQKQAQPQSQPQPGQWSGGSQQVLSTCIQSAAQMTLYAQQAAQAGNHQLAQQLTQSSQQLLAQLGQNMSAPQGGKQNFTMPQQEYAGKQTRSRKQRQSTNQQDKVLQTA